MQARTRTIVLMLLAAIGPMAANAATPTVTISPGYTNLGVNQTLQYTATVTGLTNTAVTWEVSGVKGGNATLGTISTGGLYKAPATVPTASTLIEALASDGKTVSVMYVNIEGAGPAILSITPNPVPLGNFTLTITGAGFKSGAYVLFNGAQGGSTFVNSSTLTYNGWWGTAGNATIQIENPGTLWGAPFTVQFKSTTPQKIAPTSAKVILGQTQQFSSSGATGWMASAGTISSTGLYTAPATMPASTAVTVTATGPGGQASAAVTLQPLPPQTIVPTAATLDLTGTQQFTSSGATKWVASAGTISPAGFYTAPSTAPASGTATVTATGPGGNATATVTIINSLPTTISPPSAILMLGATQQFTSNGTTWTATYGTVTSAGVYTAPAKMPSSAMDTVTAKGPAGSASATVALVPPTPVVTAVGSGQLPLGIFSAAVTGSGFISTSVATLNGATITTVYNSPNSLTVFGFAGQTGQESLIVSNASVQSQPITVQVGVTNPLVSSAAARRFLEQAAFGPTPSDATNVQTLGYQDWLNQQFAMPQISNYNSLVNTSQGGLPEQFLANAVMNPDQLRQKVAFALSQIFVTSINTIIWNDSMARYQQMLIADAFTNYRQILEDVTLSPTMGQYLNMANNAKASPVEGTVANENYAREVMQLFTIGTNMLNADGTPQFNSSGLFVPAYTQSTIGETARVFTGWTYQPTSGPVEWGDYINPAGPMVPYPSEHDTGSKQLVNGYVAPSGLSPQEDLDGALDNIFNHPNVGPFVSKLLIQHLVKSNPSPAYVSRVAQVFANDGNGVRGDMRAIVTAILLDPEARANDNGGDDQPMDGHLQEPILYVAGVVRAFAGTMTTQDYFGWDLVNLNQDLYNAPSVFNYYSPTFNPPGSSVIGPEFQIYTPDSAIYRANMVANFFSSWSNPVLNYGPGTFIDVTPYMALAPNPSTLVAALDLTLTHGTMPSQMKQDIITAVTNDTNGNLSRVLTGSWLILSSSYYNVWH